MKTFRRILQYFADLLQSQRDILTAQAAIVGELRSLKAERSEQLERTAAAVEALADMKRAQLSQSHPHLVR